MANYRVVIDGEDVTKKCVRPTFRLNRVENQGARCSAFLFEQAYTIGDTLQIYNGENLIFQGEIEKENIKKGEFICYASDKLIILSDEAATNEDHRIYEEVRYDEVITDLLSYYLSGEFDVTNVDQTTGKTTKYLDLSTIKLNECLKTCARRSRYTFWLEPPNYLYLKPIETISSGYSIIYGTNIEKIDVIRDNYVKTKVAVVFQKGNLKTFIEVGTGTRTIYVTDDRITESADATDLGNAILDELQDIQIRGELRLTEPRDDLIPGKTVLLHAPQYGFSNETIRIKEVTITPYGTTVSVGQVGGMIDQTIVTFEERIKYLEDRAIEWLLSCTTAQQTAAGCTGPCEVTCEHACEVPCEPTCQAACQSGCQYGTCEGALCQTTCQLNEQLACTAAEQTCGVNGICQVACESGHKCQTACEQQCQNYCQTGDCQIGCETACETACEISCQDACQGACQITCETTPCQTACQLGACQTECQTGPCQTTCELACQHSCQTGCKIGCEVESLCCGTIGPY